MRRGQNNWQESCQNEHHNNSKPKRKKEKELLAQSTNAAKQTDNFCSLKAHTLPENPQKEQNSGDSNNYHEGN